MDSPTSTAVPVGRNRTTYSIGPGATTGAQNASRSLDEIIDMSGSEWKPDEKMCSIIKCIERYEGAVAVPADPDVEPLSEEETSALEARLQDRTWGFYVFVTEYSPTSQAALPGVLDKIIWSNRLCVGWHGKQSSPQAVSDEVIRRMRLEIIEDEELAGASIDFLRKGFLTLIREKRPDFFPGEELPPGGIRSWIFLVLDQEAIQTIEAINMPPDFDPMKSGPHLDIRREVLKAVDA